MLVNTGCKWVLVATAMVLAAWFGYSNPVYAVTYGQLNAQRKQVGLPLLTGNNQTDFQMLVRECYAGIKYSCALAQQLQGKPQQRRSSPVPSPGQNPPKALSPDQERFCRQQEQDAMFLGQFEAQMAYTRCVSAMIQHEMNQMETDNCAQFGINCSLPSSSSHSGNNSQGSNDQSRTRDCYSNCDEAERNCNKISRFFSTPGGYSECSAERRSCDVRCR